MKISIKAFDGITPRLTDNLLSATDAQTAANCKLERGDLRSWKEPSLEENLTSTTVSALFEFDGDFITDSLALDYARSPIAEDQYGRVYYTGYDEARFHANTDEYPTYYKLGIPAPTVQAEVEVETAGTGTEESRSYAHTLVNRFGEEGPPSPITDFPDTNFKSDDTITYQKIGAIPTTRGITTLRLYRTAVGSTDVAEYYFVKDYTLPTTIGVWESGVSSADDGDYYEFNDGTDNVIYKCTNDSTTCDPNDATNGVSGSGAAYWEYYSVEDDVETSTMLSTGVICPSETYLPPPDDLRGLIKLSNGMFAGFVSGDVYFSVPNLPHAWPDESLAVGRVIVGLGAFGSTLVVATDSNPSLVYGDSPETMQEVPINDIFPCESKRSITSAGQAVYYASNVGLIQVTQDGAVNITEAYLTSEDWDEISPENIVGHIWTGKYFGFNSFSGTSFVFELATKNYTTLSETISAVYRSYNDGNLYVVVLEPEDDGDPGSDEIYKIKQWEGDEYNRKRYVWRSKKFLLGSKIKFAAARVIIDETYYTDLIDDIEQANYLAEQNEDMIDDNELLGAIGDAELNRFAVNDDALVDISSISVDGDVTFKLFVDGSSEAKFEKVIDSSKPFKLPSKYRCRQVEVQISGYVPIHSVEIATSMQELSVA